MGTRKFRDNYRYDKKLWERGNKKKVIFVAKITTATVILGAMAYLIKENKRKTELLDYFSYVAIKYMDKYEKAVELCERKDSFMNSFISELLRKGNSEGARQMAYKRWNG